MSTIKAGTINPVHIEPLKEAVRNEKVTNIAINSNIRTFMTSQDDIPYLMQGDTCLGAIESITVSEKKVSMHSRTVGTDNEKITFTFAIEHPKDNLLHYA